MKSMVFCGAMAAALMGLISAASAAPSAPAAKPATHDCFLSSAWQGWRAPDDKTLYLRVNINEVYRVDLSAGSSLLKSGDSHLINVEHGSSLICSPIDLQLSVAENGMGSFREPLIAKAITKLTPEQVAAIPKKYLP
jgi:hypothetical protein